MAYKNDSQPKIVRVAVSSLFEDNNLEKQLGLKPNELAYLSGDLPEIVLHAQGFNPEPAMYTKDKLCLQNPGLPYIPVIIPHFMVVSAHPFSHRAYLVQRWVVQPVLFDPSSANGTSPLENLASTYVNDAYYGAPFLSFTYPKGLPMLRAAFQKTGYEVRELERVRQPVTIEEMIRIRKALVESISEVQTQTGTILRVVPQLPAGIRNQAMQALADKILDHYKKLNPQQLENEKSFLTWLLEGSAPPWTMETYPLRFDGGRKQQEGAAQIRVPKTRRRASSFAVG